MEWRLSLQARCATIHVFRITRERSCRHAASRSWLLLATGLLAADTACAETARPVATVRVAFDRDGITATQAEGLADIAAGRRITADDPARIASVSKLVLAIGVMQLVDEGTLDLDADVSALQGQPLRNPAHPDTPITLRMLLSHTSSLTDNAGYWNVPLGEDGSRITRQAEAWDAEHPPGGFFRYANLNYPLIAQVMEAVTGERFDRLMLRLVMRPLGLDACHNWSGCSGATRARAVMLYDTDGQPQRDDLHGRLPNCLVIAARDGSCDIAGRWRAGRNGTLFSPQGGLRISANDLARIGRMLLNDGMIDGERILSPAAMQALATPVWTYDGSNGTIIEEDEPDRRGFFCSYGLAMQHLARGNGSTCRDDLFGDGRARMGHSGNAYGLLSGLWIDRAAGTGVAYFATGVPNNSNGTRSNFSAIEEELAAGW